MLNYTKRRRVNGRLRIMNEHGDQEVAFTTPEQLQAAQRLFDQHLKNGWLAFDRSQEKQLKNDDRLSDESDVVMTPQVLVG